MSFDDRDDEITPLEIDADPEARRRRRSSTSAIDSSEHLLQQLRAIDGIHVPEDGYAVLEAKATISRLVHAVLERGKRSCAIEVAQLERDLAHERERREACNANSARLKESILKAARGEISLRDLAQEVLRPTTNPPGGE